MANYKSYQETMENPMPGNCITLAEIVDESLSALDSLTTLLIEGGHGDVAAISAGLLRDTRTRLQSAVRCLESTCGHPILLRNVDGVLCPAPCICEKNKSKQR